MGKRPDNAFGVFINCFIKSYRDYEDDCFTVALSGIGSFVSDSDTALEKLLECLYEAGILVKFIDNNETIDQIDVHFVNETSGNSGDFTYPINCLPMIAELASRTNLSLPCIIVMQVVSKLICTRKTLYKAIILDLDDTLWKGTLSEEGIESISKNMTSSLGEPFISFMKFVKRLAEDFGIFVAICSRNNFQAVTEAIEYLDDTIFPLKNQIDYIIANDNDKSDNIALIIEQLSILPNAVVFIDDNEVVRDEVKEKCPDVFVPEWRNHYELMSTLIGGCIFDRNELSKSSQKRRKNFRIIQAERRNNSLPKLSVKAIHDNGHIEAKKLYSKSNQFRFTKSIENFPAECDSIFFEIYRETGECLDVGAVATYLFKENTLHILNWAMSCRYFDIGLEELVMQYFLTIAEEKQIIIEFTDTGKNNKVLELLEKYPYAFVQNDDNTNLFLVGTNILQNQLKINTNLELQ